MGPCPEKNSMQRGLTRAGDFGQNRFKEWLKLDECQFIIHDFIKKGFSIEEFKMDFDSHFYNILSNLWGESGYH